MTLSWTDNTETPQAALSLSAWQSGVTLPPLEAWLWSDRGDPLASGDLEVSVHLQAYDPDEAAWVTEGSPPLEELWFEVRTIGVSNRGDSGFSVQLTGWRPFGAGHPLKLGSIPADCSVHLEIRATAPSYAEPRAYQFRLSESSRRWVTEAPRGSVGSGIVTAAGRFLSSGLLAGGEVTPSAPADEVVHAASARYQLFGLYRGALAADLTLNQTDGTAVALATGQHYWAAVVLTAAGYATVKGDGSADPSKPALSSGEVLAAWVKIREDPGGLSLIDSSDITPGPRSRHQVTSGAGLTVEVGSGVILAQGQQRSRPVPEVLAAPDDAVRYLYSAGDASWILHASDSPTESGHLGPLAEITTAAGAVTSIRDLRPYAGRQVYFRFAGLTPGAAGLPIGLPQIVEQGRLHWRSTVLRVSDQASLGTATSGETRATVRVNGAERTLAGPPDARPAVAYDSPDLVDRSAVHDDGLLVRGDVVSVTLEGLPVGGTPESLELVLICDLEET